MNAAYISSFGIFLLVSIPASIIDIRTFRIPDILTYSGCAVLILTTAFLNTAFLSEALTAGAIGLLVFYLIRRFTKGLGLGDVKFAAFVGLFCGLQVSFFAYLIASVTGMLFALLLLTRRKFTRKQPIAFAPFLAFGAIAAKIGALYMLK